jgi:hypothetical protein
MTELFRDLAEAPEPTRLTRGLWGRRAVLTLLALLAVLALLGRFGQVTSSSSTATAVALLSLDAPETVRGGLFFQSRIDIRALRDVQHPRLVLDRGWVEGMQVNSIEPSPTGEASRDGKVVLSYDALKAGDRMAIWLQFEVDPTNVGRRSYGLELDDADRPIAHLDRTIRVLP